MKYDLAHLNAMVSGITERNEDDSVDVGISKLIYKIKPLHRTDNPLAPKFKIDEVIK